MKKKLSLLLLCFPLFAGCGTFGLPQIRRAEASMEFAKKIFAKNDYKALLAKMNLPAAGVKSVGPVQLYSSVNEFLSVDQALWNYVQRVTRNDGIECYSAIAVMPAGQEAFRLSGPGKFYCVRSDDSFVMTEF